MNKLPSLPYHQTNYSRLAKGWLDVVRQRGSHIRLQKRVGSEALKTTVPAHRPVKRSTPAQILKQAQLGVDEFLKLL
ncbi:MAG: type II toxin-antitoxin system HicA family toxin [Chloracidobacterium sp.]|nr:type II toxin-antitoxin system HicA family toxin [Chloracidobacterium sp.]MDW8218794.1 type II toxin-antitoxin system HicA family toxin [Acidobacteriota bacterium]